MILGVNAPATKKPKPRAGAAKKSKRPALDPSMIYSRHETRLVAGGISHITIVRAYLNGHLCGYRIGNRVHHSGQQIIDWLNAGGKTGAGKER